MCRISFKDQWRRATLWHHGCKNILQEKRIAKYRQDVMILLLIYLFSRLPVHNSDYLCLFTDFVRGLTALSVVWQDQNYHKSTLKENFLCYAYYIER